MEVIKLEDGGVIIHLKYEDSPGSFVRLGETQKDLLLIKLLQAKGISWEASIAAKQWVGVEESEGKHTHMKDDLDKDALKEAQTAYDEALKHEEPK